MPPYVDISFDCLPLRSISRFDVPIDASPAFRAKCERILAAIAGHGSHNTYYLHNARCTFHLTNDADVGLIDFTFEGVAHTDASDEHTVRCNLTSALERETCDWLTEPIVAWFQETVAHAVRVEFDRYIAAGDLARAFERIQMLESETEKHGGYLGMFL